MTKFTHLYSLSNFSCFEFFRVRSPSDFISSFLVCHANNVPLIPLLNAPRTQLYDCTQLSHVSSLSSSYECQPSNFRFPLYSIFNVLYRCFLMSRECTLFSTLFIFCHGPLKKFQYCGCTLAATVNCTIQIPLLYCMKPRNYICPYTVHNMCNIIAKIFQLNTYLYLTIQGREF